MKTIRKISLLSSLLIILFCIIILNIQTAIATNVCDTQAPTTPSNLSASSVTLTSITIVWTTSTDNIGVKGYQVFKDGAKIATSSSPTYTSKSLTPGRTYTYSIKAYDNAGNLSDESAPLIVSTLADTEAPSVPANLAISSVTTRSINFKWDASTDNMSVKGYQIFRDGTKIATTCSPTYSNSGLMPGTSYVYTIKSYDAYNNISDESVPVSFSTQEDTQAPSVPSGISASTVTTLSITLSWSASTDDSGVKGYEIYRNGVKVGTTTNTTYKNSGLLPGTSYTYSLKSYDITGKYSDNSDALTFATAPDTQAPTVPENLSIKSATNTKVVLIWNASTDDTGIKGYDIYCDGLKITTTKSLTYTNSGLTPGTTYNYSVAAIDLGDNSSEQSSILSFTTSNAPSSPTCLNVSSKTDSSLVLSWSAPKSSSNVSGYEVYRDGTLIGSVTGTNYSDSSLSGNTTYVYTVKAFNEKHELSNSSSPLSVSTSLLITGDVVWTPENNPYILNGGMVIAQDASLQIMPGVIVKINPCESVTVNGSLNAYGSDDGKVIFTSTNDSTYGGTGITGPSDYWETFNITATGQFTGSDLIIVYGNNLFNVQGSLSMMNSEIAFANTSGITIAAQGQFSGSGLKIHDCCHAELCKGINTMGNVSLSDSEIYNCPGTGILVGTTGELNATSVKIHDCGKGIEIQGTVNLILCQISNCDYGLYFNTTSNNALILNSLMKNNEYGVYNNKPTEIVIDMSGNYWGSPNGPSVFNDTTQSWEGDGDRVSSGVNYSDWLQDPLQ